MAHEDVQALVAFLGDCADSAVVEDVAEALAAMLVPSGFVCRQLTTVCQVTSSLEASNAMTMRRLDVMLNYGSCFVCGSRGRAEMRARMQGFDCSAHACASRTAFDPRVICNGRSGLC